MVPAIVIASPRAARRMMKARGCVKPPWLTRRSSGRVARPLRLEQNFRELIMSTPNIQLWEVFIRSRNGLAHKHVGSLHAADAVLAIQAARDIYTRRGEGLSIWIVPSDAIIASDPAEKDMMFEPAMSKIYRHPTFYDVPDEVGHM
jgi:ring-1,2-phenylacetyl-CoA epoxidase subunit PaaB